METKGWDREDNSRRPEAGEVAAYVGSPLWGELCGYLEAGYRTAPLFEYSRCSLHGWNVKYRKAGRSLCTLYPMRGYYTAMVVVGDRERAAVEQELPCLTEYVRRVYRESGGIMGQKWLLIDVREPAVLEDVKRLIAIRRAPEEPR